MALEKTTLVLLPGLDGTEVFFRPLLAALPVWINPVVVTFPPTGPNGYADLLPVVRAAIAGHEDFYILGWSFSGPLALMIAASEPVKTKGVILCASFVRSPLPGRLWPRLLAFAPFIGFLRFVRRVPIFLGKSPGNPYRRDKAETWSRVSAAVLAKRIRAILAVDARDHLHTCPRRVLYLASSHDEIVSPNCGDEVVREKENAVLITIDGPHLAMYTNPLAAVGAIVPFMEGG
jgi:hypothetical protein